MDRFEQPSETSITISAKRAAQILASYGGNPARWPAAERSGVLAALNKFPDLAQARQSAIEIDLLLSASPSHSLSPDLADRIFTAAINEPPMGGWRKWLDQWDQMASAPFGLAQTIATLFLATTLGLVAGIFLPAGYNDVVAEEFSQLAFDPAYQTQVFEDKGASE